MKEFLKTTYAFLFLALAPYSLGAATTGNIDLTGTVDVELDLVVDSTPYVTHFTSDQLTGGMLFYQDVADLHIHANEFYTVTLSNLLFTHDSLTGNNTSIPFLVQLLPHVGSADLGQAGAGDSRVFDINARNDGSVPDLVSIKIDTGNTEAASGSWSATIQVDLASQ